MEHFETPLNHKVIKQFLNGGVKTYILTNNVTKKCNEFVWFRYVQVYVALAYVVEEGLDANHPSD